MNQVNKSSQTKPMKITYSALKWRSVKPRTASSNTNSVGDEGESSMGGYFWRIFSGKESIVCNLYMNLRERATLCCQETIPIFAGKVKTYNVESEKYS
jgi:hypothetical protein